MGHSPDITMARRHKLRGPGLFSHIPQVDGQVDRFRALVGLQVHAIVVWVILMPAALCQFSCLAAPPESLGEFEGNCRSSRTGSIPSSTNQAHSKIWTFAGRSVGVSAPGMNCLIRGARTGSTNSGVLLGSQSWSLYAGCASKSVGLPKTSCNHNKQSVKV